MTSLAILLVEHFIFQRSDSELLCIRHVDLGPVHCKQLLTGQGASDETEVGGDVDSGKVIYVESCEPTPDVSLITHEHCILDCGSTSRCNLKDTKVVLAFDGYDGESVRCFIDVNNLTSLSRFELEYYMDTRS